METVANALAKEKLYALGEALNCPLNFCKGFTRQNFYSTINVVAQQILNGSL
jgi:hypothetical protein